MLSTLLCAVVVRELSFTFINILSLLLYLAGYCVVTYLLGVGDRHLDNLLVAPDGKLVLSNFHHKIFN